MSGLCAPVKASSELKKTISLGYFNSEGKYYDRLKIRIQSIPFAIKLQHGSMRFKVSSSVNKVNNPNNTPATLIENRQGIGNTYLNLRQLFKPPLFIHFIDIGTKAKLPTASNNSNNRQIDLELNSNMYQRFGKNWLSAKFAHRWRFNSVLNNTFAVAIGTSRKINQHITPGVLMDYRQASSPSGEPRRELMLYLQYKAQHKMRYTYYIIKGNSKSSPSWASGLQMNYRW